MRGELVIRAGEHDLALERGEKRPFAKVVYCNIGNPQQLGQAPITFGRQVISMCTYPALLESAAALKMPADAVARARKYLKAIPGGTGAYSHSMGVRVVREEVAEFIQRRDGHKAREDDIFLTDGASPAVQMMLRALIRGPQDGIMIPIPQYPLYSATIALCGGKQVGYFLDEKNGWGMRVDELERSLAEAKKQGVNVRALAVINPGNPTGGCMSPENIRDVVAFAAKHNLVVLADEVYQENIWRPGAKFTSFKRVAAEAGAIVPGTDKGDLQLVSFHSVSKGFLGECGRRGGYMELVGFDEDVRMQLYKLASVSLCSNLDGQLMMGLMVNPPRKGEESFDLYQAERDGILTSLRRRAQTLTTAFKSMEGFSVETPEGALYAFPQITLPPRAIEAAKKAGKAPDTFYCLQMLDQTGVVVVPGSGFGQQPGTFHFRTTILPPENEIAATAERLGAFHRKFMDQWR